MKKEKILIIVTIVLVILNVLGIGALFIKRSTPNQEEVKKEEKPKDDGQKEVIHTGGGAEG